MTSRILIYDDQLPGVFGLLRRFKLRVSEVKLQAERDTELTLEGNQKNMKKFHLEMALKATGK